MGNSIPNPTNATLIAGAVGDVCPPGHYCPQQTEVTFLNILIKFQFPEVVATRERSSRRVDSIDLIILIIKSMVDSMQQCFQRRLKDSDCVDWSLGTS